MWIKAQQGFFSWPGSLQLDYGVVNKRSTEDEAIIVNMAKLHTVREVG